MSVYVLVFLRIGMCVYVCVYLCKLWLGQRRSQVTSVSVNTPPTQNLTTHNHGSIYEILYLNISTTFQSSQANGDSPDLSYSRSYIIYLRIWSSFNEEGR